MMDFPWTVILALADSYFCMLNVLFSFIQNPFFILSLMRKFSCLGAHIQKFLTVQRRFKLCSISPDILDIFLRFGTKPYCMITKR